MNMKYAISILLIISFIGCNLEDKSMDIIDSDVVSDDVISVEEALSGLGGFISDIQPLTRNNRNEFKVSSVSAFGAEDVDFVTRSLVGVDLPDTLVYLVEFVEDEGFAILSANRMLSSSIYAVSENGKMSKDDFRQAFLLFNNVSPTDSCEVDYFNDLGRITVPALIISSIMGDISIQNNGPDENLVDDKTPDFSDGESSGQSSYTISKFGPYLKTKWSQGSPFNDLLNGCKAGCVAVAASQIIVANRVSNTMNFNGKLCSWDNLESVCNYSDPSNPGNAESKSQVANFMKVIGDGEHCNIDYGVDGSSGLAKGVKRAFKALGYNNVNKYTGFGKENKNRANSMLKNGKPVYLDGCRSLSAKGHAWVLDGYLIRRERGTERSYYHINWGWNGDCDGYYSCGTFDTTSGLFKDSVIDAKTDINRGDSKRDYTWTYRMVTYDL